MFLFCKWFPNIKSKIKVKKKFKSDTDCIVDEILNYSGEEK